MYALILESIKTQRKLTCILPVLGRFHTEAAFMATIHKRFVGSGLDDLVVAAVIVEAGFEGKVLQTRNATQ